MQKILLFSLKFTIAFPTSPFTITKLYVKLGLATEIEIKRENCEPIKKKTWPKKNKKQKIINHIKKNNT